MSGLYIEELEIAAPEIFLSSEELEQRLVPLYQRIGLNPGRLELMTGVKTRGVWPSEIRPSDIALIASKKLKSIEDANYLINCSVCRDQWEPSTASRIQHFLELKKSCVSFDLSNACLGVFSGVDIARSLIKDDQKVVLVSGENSEELLNSTIDYLNNNEQLTRKTIKPHMASLTIGSAGVALVLSNKKGLFEIKKQLTLSDVSVHDLCKGGLDPKKGVLMETYSEDLLHAGIQLASLTWNKFKEGIDKNFKVITHQVGSKHHDLLLDTLRIPKEKSFQTFSKYGNTGSVAAWHALYLAKEDGLVQKGDTIVMMGIGSGVHCSMLELRC
jgi:3-oxoacyl-[acyl-carrier-protein] synthase-3